MAKLEFSYREAFKALGILTDNLGNMSRFFKNLADLELSDTLLRYNDEVNPDGKKWETPNTRRRTRKSKPNTRKFNPASDKILKDTGQLFSSIGAVYGKDFMEVGTNLKYGKYVQEKGFEFIGASKNTEENIKYSIVKFLMQGLK